MSEYFHIIVMAKTGEFFIAPTHSRIAEKLRSQNLLFLHRLLQFQFLFSLALIYEMFLAKLPLFSLLFIEEVKEFSTDKQHVQNMSFW